MKNEFDKIFVKSECPSTKALHRFHEGKLRKSELHLIEKHLASCEACSDEMEGIKIINNNEKLNGISKELISDINTRLGININKSSYVFYSRIAAVIAFCVVSAFIIYLTVNSNKSTTKNELAQNTESPKTENDKPIQEQIKTAEKTSDILKKNSSLSEETGIKSENKASLKKQTKAPVSIADAGSALDNTAMERLNSDKKANDIESDKNIISGKAGSKDNILTNDGAGYDQTNFGTGSGIGSGKMAVQKSVVINNDNPVKADEQKPVFSLNATNSDNSNSIQTKNESEKNIITENKNIQQNNLKNPEEKEEFAKTNKNLKSKTRAETSVNDISQSKIEKSEKKKGKKDKSSEYKVGNSETISPAPGESYMPSGIQSSNFEEAMKKYNSGKYEEALQIFQQITDINPSDHKTLYYEGICNYELNNLETAVNNFNLVINLVNNTFSEDARWYLALTNIKKNNKESAKKTLLEIISIGGKHKNNAEKKLNDLK